jgi:2-dehydro-3-deoxy-L-rhamnonate dehydrogenase (NAD+)
MSDDPSGEPIARRTAIVTGAARGIGLAIAERLLADGARVVLADLDAEALAATAMSLGEGSPDLLTSVTDVSSADQVDELVALTTRSWGHIDVLVNNAGIAGPAKPMWEYGEGEWEHVLATNLTSIFLLCRAVLPLMLARRRGRIVNIASISGKEGNPNMAAYSTSKAAVLGLTKALAKEVARDGVYVNAVTPAVVETDILRQLNPDAVRYMIDRIPMGRTGKPEEVAALVAWLSSDECSFSTGAVFDISGGRATY